MLVMGQGTELKINSVQTCSRHPAAGHVKAVILTSKMPAKKALDALASMGMWRLHHTSPYHAGP